MQPHSISATGTRLPGLDLLRAIAIVWVMLYHVSSYGVRLPAFIEFGWMGVDLFFVLSGFLIGGQVLGPYALGERPRWGHFFLRRALRVLPAYLVVLAIYFTIPAVRESPAIQPLWQFLTFTQNLFADYHHARAFSHAWSLCIEEHFYLLLPLVVWLAARKPGAVTVATMAVAVLAGGMLLRGWIWEHDVEAYFHLKDGPGNFYDRYVENIYNPTYARLDGLFAGLMLAVVKAFRARWWAWLMRHPWPLILAGLAGVYATMWIETPSLQGAVFGFPLVSLSLASVLAGAASPRCWPGRCNVPGMRPLAAMAFSLYLTHKAVYHLVRSNAPGPLPDSAPLALAIYLGAALAAGAVLYLSVERPFLRLRERSFTSARSPRRPERSGC